jgi:formamidopyrimidine-DNA glycosylase
MPELPEVETTLRGIEPYLVGRRIARLEVREPRFRLPIPPDLPERLVGREVEGLVRRGKYILIAVGDGTLILHLGMSGSLRVLPAETPPARHDHWDLCLADGVCLRLRDPRRFGLLVWTQDPPDLAQTRHPLLKDLGPEPLGHSFDGAYLYRASRGRRAPVKSFVMDADVVVGVGNIYANESLYLACIRPTRAANRIGPERYARLAECVRQVLSAAIDQGGTTLRDFVQEDGHPGYFAQHLQVYGRAGEPCPTCSTPLAQMRIAQRASYFCPRCQR